MHCQWGRKPPKLLLPLVISSPSEEDRATAIDNMHRKFDKDRACSGDILADRQTDTHTQTCSSHYFATDPMGKVIKTNI